jgi:hypothetical protein
MVQHWAHLFQLTHDVHLLRHVNVQLADPVVTRSGDYRQRNSAKRKVQFVARFRSSSLWLNRTDTTERISGACATGTSSPSAWSRCS